MSAYVDENGNIEIVQGDSLTLIVDGIDTDENYTPDTEVVANGEFQESKFRSAPYFDVKIDGINLLDTKF